MVRVACSLLDLALACLLDHCPVLVWENPHVHHVDYSCVKWGDQITQSKTGLLKGSTIIKYHRYQQSSKYKSSLQHHPAWKPKLKMAVLNSCPKTKYCGCEKNNKNKNVTNTPLSQGNRVNAYEQQIKLLMFESARIEKCWKNITRHTASVEGEQFWWTVFGMKCQLISLCITVAWLVEF